MVYNHFIKRVVLEILRKMTGLGCLDYMEWDVMMTLIKEMTTCITAVIVDKEEGGGPVTGFTKV